MIIERIYIESFGVLKNINLSTNSQINVFYGENESGKSTIAAFLKFIFYGYKGHKSNSTAGAMGVGAIGEDKTKILKNIKEAKEEENIPIAENEKRLYTPWSADKVAGNIIVHFKDKKYKIEREFTEREKTRVVDLNTNMAILDGEDPGEFFFKMPEEVFVKTAFLKQFDTSETGGEELSDMIQNIMFTADEDINTQKTLKRLEDAKNLLLTEDDGIARGVIANITKKRNALQESLEESVKDQRELFQMEGKIKDIEEKMLANNAKKSELFDELENYRAYNAGQELHKIENARRQVNTLEAEYNKVVERHRYEDFIPTEEYSKELLDIAAELEKKKEKLNNNLHYRETAFKKYNECIEKNNSFKIIEHEGGIEDIGEEYTKLKKREKLFTILGILFIALYILTAAGMAFAYLAAVLTNIIILIAIPLPFIILVVTFFILRGKNIRKVEEFYQSFDFNSESDFAAVLDDYPDTEAQLEIFKADLDICNDNVIDCEKEFDSIYNEAKSLLLNWNKTPESDDKDIKDFVKFANQASEANDKIIQAKNIYEQYKSQLDLMLEGVDENQLKKLAADARTPNYDEKRIARDLEILVKANDHMHQMEHEVEKNIAVASKLPEPIILYVQIMFLDSKIEELTQKYNSLCFAIETLKEACDELKNSVSPRLSEMASNLFKMATGGQYSGLFVNPELELNFNDNLTSKSVEFLSASTKDIAYMCLRLALLDLLFENEMPPLICDDSFVRLDRNRFENLSKVMSAISRKTQIFIFTCHEREASLFSQLGANIITM